VLFVNVNVKILQIIVYWYWTLWVFCGWCWIHV